jgi:3-oxoadipate enol-lactonase
MRTQIENFSMYYDSQGSGKPVLLIHGYPLNHMMWQPQLSCLSDIAQIITLDLRGHGDSDSAPSPAGDPQTYSMDMHASDCSLLLNSLGVTQPVVIAGLSMGGYIAFSFFRRYPERVAGLILAATRPGSDSAEAKANRQQAIDSALKSGIDAVVEAMLPKMLAPVTYKNRPEVVERVASIMSNTSLEAIIGDQQGMMERPDSSALLQSIQVPALLIHGADDQIIKLEDMENMHALIPSSDLHIIPDAGHLVNLEQPELFNKTVQAFIVKLSH